MLIFKAQIARLLMKEIMVPTKNTLSRIKLPHKEILAASPNEFKQNCHTMKSNKPQLRNEFK